MKDQLYKAAADVTVPVALLLIGGLLMALGTARLGMWLPRFLAPGDPSEPHEHQSDRGLHLFSLASTSTGADLLVVVAHPSAPGEADVLDHTGSVVATFTEWRRFDGGRHTFCWSKLRLHGLTPASTVQLRARADDYVDSPPAHIVTLPTADTDRIGLVVGSRYDRGNAEVALRLIEAYERVGNTDGAHRSALHFWLGDQVYVDAPWTAGLRASDAWDVVAGKYLDTWEVGPRRDPEVGLGAMLRRGSNWFLPDDHEFWNGYPQLSFVTLTAHATQRAIRQFLRLLRPGTSPHPASQGVFGRATGHGYVVFQSTLDAPEFDESVTPAQVQELDFDAARLLLADTRWARTIRRRLRNAGFMLDADLDHLLSRLDTDKLVVLMLARPMIGHPPKKTGRFALDVGTEAYYDQYNRLCKAVFDRAEAGRPTLLIGGDVHVHAVRDALDHRVLEIVSSPMSLLGGGATAFMTRLALRMHQLVAVVRYRVSRLFGRPAVAPDSFPVYDADRVPAPQQGTTIFPTGRIDDGLVGLDLDLSDPARPVVTYRGAAQDSRDVHSLVRCWTGDRWEPEQTTG
ncbi:MAG: hypothetical protein P8N02_08730 [Actinomycetota bacterium]|nr:hypothetical protein [Actinomycetota bacterium]